jgi:ferredoxin
VTAIDVETRACLYQILAEVLLEPPEWMSESGERWLLTRLCKSLADFEENPDFGNAELHLSSIPSEDVATRRERHRILFHSGRQKPLPLSESLMRDGCLVGPITFTVKSIYEVTGLHVAEAELPDHVSVELAFLAYLAKNETQSVGDSRQWRTARRLFIEQHAGKWISELGELLVDTGDLVYAPIGYLLSALLPEAKFRTSRQRITQHLPDLQSELPCTLCGFCVQTCPTRALTIHETSETTTLQLSPKDCIACGRCVRVCMTNTLHMQRTSSAESPRILYQSPRLCCTGCGSPMISEAEFAAITEQIGTPAWISYCLDCRSLLMERNL